MNKLNRLVVGLGLGLLTLFMVMPTMSTASADGYTSNSSSGDSTAAVVIGVVAVGGIVDALYYSKSSAKPAPPQ